MNNDLPIFWSAPELAQQHRNSNGVNLHVAGKDAAKRNTGCHSFHFFFFILHLSSY